MIEKKICISCRLEINSDALFCSKCGIKQDREDIDISINRLIIPYSPLEVDEVLRVSLESDNDLLNKIYGAFSGVEFEEFKYSLLEARYRDIPFTNTLKKRIEKRYQEFISETLTTDFLKIKDSIFSKIESKFLEIDNDKIIEAASCTDEELLEELQIMGEAPSFYIAKYVILEMQHREMKELSELFLQVRHIEYVHELKEDFQIIKSANKLAIDLKKTNKRLDKFERGQKLREHNSILKDETETLEEPLVNIEPEIKDYVESNSDFKIIGIMILIFLGFVFYIITKSSGSEKSKSQSYTPTQNIDICRCLTEAGNSNYIMENGKACDKAISNAIGVENWKKINMSQSPLISQRFTDLANRCR